MVEPNGVDIPFSGTRVLHAGKTRLFEPMHKILVIADAVGLAYMAVVAIRIEANPAENYAMATCKQFPIRVCYPVLEPTLSLVRQEPLTRIPITFTPLEPVALPPGKVQTTVKGVGRTLIGAISPVFVDYYEKHQSWLRKTFGKRHSDWPPLFRFAWMLRNFISHSEGCVHFNDPNAVTWHHLSYSPADNGRLVLGEDLDTGDLIVLMFEMSDQLDRLGCPHNP